MTRREFPLQTGAANSGVGAPSTQLKSSKDGVDGGARLVDAGELCDELVAGALRGRSVIDHERHIGLSRYHAVRWSQAPGCSRVRPRPQIPIYAQGAHGYLALGRPPNKRQGR